MLARLTVHFPLRPTRTFLVQGDGSTVIGRDPGCDIVLDDDRVSRRHARLVGADGAWRLSDLGSTNGTLVSGRPAEDITIEQDAWLSFGGLLARFERSSAEREGAESRRREERHRTSISLQSELTPSLGLQRLLERVLGSVLQLSDTQRGFLLLRTGTGHLEVAARAHLDEVDLESEAFAGSVGAIERAIATAQPVAVSDTLADPFLKGRESVLAGGMRALVCLPLLSAGGLVGVIYADSREPGASFGELDVEILTSLAAHAAMAIIVARTDRELRAMAARLPAGSWTRIVAHHEARAQERP
jgi:pSer/pThr/pTyr-binding forkhead associated (FHA) protein